MNHEPDPLDSSAVAEELFTVNLTEIQIYRFWSKSRKSEGGCWDWQYAKDKKGYGKLAIKYPGTQKSRMLVSHRVAYFLTHGSFPARLSVLHHCDRPICCNPEHLFLGTQLDNIRDMDRKGRRCTHSPNRPMGERVNTAKLDVDQVREIRRLFDYEGYTQVKIAAIYGVSSANISDIVRRETWKSVF